ncbi:MAG: hypothetical protein RML56_13540 [Burkholderiales bacterium]|nr:hypothetical protein [Burkholderiales bacterium]
MDEGKDSNSSRGRGPLRLSALGDPSRCNPDPLIERMAQTVLSDMSAEERKKAEEGLQRLLAVARRRWGGALDDVQLLLVLHKDLQSDALKRSLARLAMGAKREGRIAIAFKATTYLLLLRSSGDYTAFIEGIRLLAERVRAERVQKKSAAKKRHEAHSKTADFAWGLYCSRSWRSIADFARRNRTQIVDHARKLGWRMSPDRYETTVKAWISARKRRSGRAEISTSAR